MNEKRTTTNPLQGIGRENHLSKQTDKCTTFTDRSSIKHLKKLYLIESRHKYPNVPEYGRACPNYKSNSTNGLTRCVIDFLKFSGHQAERISNTGRPIDNTKVVKDVIGFQRRIGSITWIPGSGTNGTADVSSVILGRAVKIEIKNSLKHDRQSEAQKEYQKAIEDSGGIYIIASSFALFLNFYYANFEGGANE